MNALTDECSNGPLIFKQMGGAVLRHFSRGSHTQRNEMAVPGATTVAKKSDSKSEHKGADGKTGPSAKFAARRVITGTTTGSHLLPRTICIDLNDPPLDMNSLERS